MVRPLTTPMYTLPREGTPASLPDIRPVGCGGAKQLQLNLALNLPLLDLKEVVEGSKPSEKAQAKEQTTASQLARHTCGLSAMAGLNSSSSVWMARKSPTASGEVPSSTCTSMRQRWMCLRNSCPKPCPA